MKLLVAILAAKICSSINLDKQEANSFLRPKRAHRYPEPRYPAIGSQNCVGSLFRPIRETDQVACDCVLNTCDYEEYLESQEDVQGSVRSRFFESTRNSFEKDYRECYRDLKNQKINQYQLFLPNGEKFNFKLFTTGKCVEEWTRCGREGGDYIDSIPKRFLRGGCLESFQKKNRHRLWSIGDAQYDYDWDEKIWELT